MSKATEVRNCRGHSTVKGIQLTFPMVDSFQLHSLYRSTSSPECSLLFFPERQAFIPTSQILAMYLPVAEGGPGLADMACPNMVGSPMAWSVCFAYGGAMVRL